MKKCSLNNYKSALDMPQVTKDVPLSFGDPKQTINGYVLVNTENGDMEWFRHGDQAPTFQSNAKMMDINGNLNPIVNSSINNAGRGRPLE